ncbi:hypothetical protein Tco_0238474 [Tanacetum coccineum]
MKYNEKTGVYSCQVDEQWFDLSADLLRKALAITPVIPAHPFELPPSGKTSSSDKPRHPVLQMLWGIVTQTNVDHAELIWEDNNNIHRRPESAVHHTGDDFILGNLKFVPKGESVEVFGMAIPDPLITEAIQQSSYYQVSGKVAGGIQRKPLRKCKRATATKACYTQKAHNHHLPVKQIKPVPPDKKLSKANRVKEKVMDAGLGTSIKLSLESSFLPQGRAPLRRDPISHDSTKLGTLFQPEDDTSEKVILNLHQHLIQNEQKVKQKPLILKTLKKANEALALDQTHEPMKEGPDRIRLWKNFMCLLAGQTLSTWMMNSSPSLPKVNEN